MGHASFRRDVSRMLKATREELKGSAEFNQDRVDGGDVSSTDAVETVRFMIKMVEENATTSRWEISSTGGYFAIRLTIVTD